MHMSSTGQKIFGGEAEERVTIDALCGDVAVSREVFKFVTYHQCRGSFGIYGPNDGFLRTIGGLHYPLGVDLDQSGHNPLPRLEGKE